MLLITVLICKSSVSALVVVDQEAEVQTMLMLVPLHDTIEQPCSQRYRVGARHFRWKLR